MHLLPAGGDLLGLDGTKLVIAVLANAVLGALMTLGIGLFAPCMLQIDEECTLHIDLSVCGMETELKLVGRVCYCTEQGEGKFRVGMRFVSLDSNTVNLLNQLLL